MRYRVAPWLLLHMRHSPAPVGCTYTCRNATLHAGLVAFADSQKGWGSSYSKDLGISPKTILKFKVGVVPFELGFDVPMQLDAEVDASEAMRGSLGATAAIVVGDITVSWTQASHWTHSTIQPTYAMTPHLEHDPAQCSGQVHASVKLQPTFNLHFNRIFRHGLRDISMATGILDWLRFTYVFDSRPAQFCAGSRYQAELKPELTAEASVQGGDLCLEASYSLSLTSMAELDINIPFLAIHKDWLWGPKQVFTSSGNPIPRKCVPVANSKNSTH
jgi:hypothetical protein